MYSIRQIALQWVSIIFFLLGVTSLFAQTDISGVINTYAAVSDIAFNTNTTTTNCSSVRLTVGTRLGAGSNFAVGDRVLIIQMKGAYPTTPNNSNFGRVDGTSNSGTASSGNFEFSNVSVVSTSGANQIVTLGTALTNIYDENSFVQLVKVPIYATGARVTATLSALDWTEAAGAGGIICFISQGTLTLNADINADGKGFEGGASVNSGGTCNTNFFYNNATSSTAGKGEGIIVKNTNLGWGKGAWANGGGGAHRDTGGGGGASAGAGGTGRRGRISGDCNNAGVGGFAVTSSDTKIYLGGGGGAGHSNGGSPSSGGDGGGIIIIEATNIITNGGARTITADGVNATNTNTTDGAGGGGGGGAIYIRNTGTYTNTGGGSLTLTTTGGNGGNAGGTGNNNCSGSGGGGGGGIIRTNSGTSLPTRTVTAGTVGTQANNCNGGSNGSDGSTQTNLVLTTNPTCTETIEDVGTLCTGSLGDNSYPDGDFGIVTGVDEVLANQAGWTAPTAVTFKGNTAPWNNIPPAGNYNYSFNTSFAPGDGAYTIVTGSRPIYTSTWITSNDNSGSSDGFMMIVNCSYEPNIFFEQTITGLCEESRYEFSVDLLNVDATSFRTVTNPGGAADFGPNCDIATDPDCPQKVFSAQHTAGGSSGGGSRVCPDIEFLIDGAVVATSGPVPNNATWGKYGVTFQTKTGVTSVTLRMRNKAPGGGGNDLGVDNISFRPCGPTATVNQPSLACNNTVYDAVVSGEYASPVYQWQYSEDGGTTWTNITGATSSSYTVASPVDIGDEIRFLVAESGTNLLSASCRVISTTETASCVLPISLIQFTAQKFDNNTAILNWKTATETNGKHFVIERSRNNTDFREIGILEAMGESKIQQNYSFLDEEIENGTYYYRLKMVDLDDSYEYSNVREVQFEATDNCLVKIFPNPSTDIAQIKPSEQLLGKEFRIINSLGQELLKSDFTRQEISLDLKNWNSGVYILKYRCNQGWQTVKFLIK